MFIPRYAWIVHVRLFGKRDLCSTGIIFWFWKCRDKLRTFLIFFKQTYTKVKNNLCLYFSRNKKKHEENAHEENDHEKKLCIPPSITELSNVYSSLHNWLTLDCLDRKKNPSKP